MTTKTEWQDANRRLAAEQREQLGDPPTAEEMLAYSRGELDADQEERIRDLIVAYPELARMYGAPFPEEPEADVTDEAIAAGFQDLQRRLGTRGVTRRAPARHYLPTTLAAALALVFFGLYVQAESRARDHARDRQTPYLLPAPQELDSNLTRGHAPVPLIKDGEVYHLRPHLINQLPFDSYILELRDATGAIWTGNSRSPDENDTFQIVIPYDFLRPGATYQLRIFGATGTARTPLGTYDVAAPPE